MIGTVDESVAAAAVVFAGVGESVAEWAADRDWDSVGLGPVGVHRDSDALERSNWQTVAGELLDRFPGAFAVLRSAHWGCGWVEELTFDAGSIPAAAAVAAWAARLDAYPVADEEHFSALEWSEGHGTAGVCESDQGEDCPCRVTVDVRAEVLSPFVDVQESGSVTVTFSRDGRAKCDPDEAAAEEIRDALLDAAEAVDIDARVLSIRLSARGKWSASLSIGDAFSWDAGGGPLRDDTPAETVRAVLEAIR